MKTNLPRFANLAADVVVWYGRREPVIARRSDIAGVESSLASAIAFLAEEGVDVWKLKAHVTFVASGDVWFSEDISAEASAFHFVPRPV